MIRRNLLLYIDRALDSFGASAEAMPSLAHPDGQGAGQELHVVQQVAGWNQKCQGLPTAGLCGRQNLGDGAKDGSPLGFHIMELGLSIALEWGGAKL